MRADEGHVAEVMSGGNNLALHDRMRLLNAALDKAVRANRPIVISRLPNPASQESSRTPHLVGDPALLAALQPQVCCTSNQITLSLPMSAQIWPLVHLCFSYVPSRLPDRIFYFPFKVLTLFVTPVYLSRQISCTLRS